MTEAVFLYKRSRDVVKEVLKLYFPEARTVARLHVGRRRW